jgi:hypothetical protein
MTVERCRDSVIYPSAAVVPTSVQQSLQQSWCRLMPLSAALCRSFVREVGWRTGLEPATFGATIRWSTCGQAERTSRVRSTSRPSSMRIDSWIVWALLLSPRPNSRVLRRSPAGPASTPMARAASTRWSATPRKALTPTEAQNHRGGTGPSASGLRHSSGRSSRRGGRPDSRPNPCCRERAESQAA